MVHRLHRVYRLDGFKQIQSPSVIIFTSIKKDKMSLKLSLAMALTTKKDQL